MSKFSLFFGNPTNKTATRTANSKPPGPIIMIDQSEIPSCSQVQFITLFFGGAQLYCAILPPTASCTNLVKKNQFPELNQHISTFLQ
jgi:hypothetical protein